MRRLKVFDNGKQARCGSGWTATHTARLLFGYCFQFGDRFETARPAGGALGVDQRGQVQAPDIPVEDVHAEGARQQPIEAAGDLAGQIDVPASTGRMMTSE
ncbi:MAG TPA: hypothetical protein VFO14_16610 [Vicinamibacterales bacterium]|nr:hypothetical protein [Vicinamibacterales bacterium]